MPSETTPGPWMVSELDRRCVVGADGLVVADVRSWRDTDDADLIAAAPALRDALEALVAANERWNEAVENIIGRTPAMPGQVDALEMAREALALSRRPGGAEGGE